LGWWGINFIYLVILDNMGLYYKGKEEKENIIFTRVWAMPCAWTFSIYPIKKLIEKYTGEGKNWIDPFAGKFSPAEITNDHDKDRQTVYHFEAIEFAKKIKGKYSGVLFDPPYSFTQIKEHYPKSIGRKATKWETSMSFYEKVKSELCDKIEIGGIAISFGWNSNGFGKARGFRIIEIMCVAHGGSKNDTICVVERKIT
jgi:hypothetical protein